MAVKSSRTKRSKTDVEQEFVRLEETIINEKGLRSAKLEMAAQIQEAEIRTAVSEITVEVISKKLSDLNIEISRTLSNLSEKMITEMNLLQSLKSAVKLESKELQQLHGIDIAATSVDQLVADYAEKKKILEVEIAKMRAEWEQEKEEKQQVQKEYEATLKKNRARENEEYEYQKFLERKKLQDQFEEEWRLKEKKNIEMQEALEKDCNEREAILKSKEAEFITLKQEVEEFSTRIATECSKAVKETSKEIEAKYTLEIAQLNRDLVVEKQIGELKIQQLQELLTNQQTQMSSLQAQLDEAKRQVQDIAIKAIEGASGAKTLAHINQIAMEQAKNRPPN